MRDRAIVDNCPFFMYAAVTVYQSGYKCIDNEFRRYENLIRDVLVLRFKAL